MPTCNICGSSDFGHGPGGRTALSGALPRCKNCQSLERHRSFRKLALKLHEISRFETMAALQFSEDPTFIPAWFKAYEISIYGVSNSIDIQSIPRPDESYDVVICNHVLEHVPDDGKALSELVRILNRNGFLFLSFPDPANREATVDWGYPDESQHGHFRLYGADALSRLLPRLSAAHLGIAREFDDATGAGEEIWLISKNAALMKQWQERAILAAHYPPGSLP